MWTVSGCVCLLILVIAAVQDIKKREISVYFLLAAGGGSILYHLIDGKMDIWLLLGGALMGILFLAISKITKEGIGYGDSLSILILGVFLGLWDSLIVISITFFLLLCTLIPLLWRKKMSRKYTLPFLPFLAGSYLVFMIMGGVCN